MKRGPDLLAENLSFKVLVSTDDPFEQVNQADYKGPIKVRPGQLLTVTFKGKPAKDHYTYPLNVEKTKQRQKSVFGFRRAEEFLPLGPVKEIVNPVTKKDTDGSPLLKQYDEFSWTQDVVILPKTKPGTYALTALIRTMVCDEKGCIGPDDYPPIDTKIEVAGEPVKMAAELLKRIELAQKAPSVVPKDPNSVETSDGGLFAFLGAAFVGAFLMLLTPCVFPMIPITVNFFLKQSEKEHHRPMSMALVYSGTIIVVLSLAVLLLGKVIIDLANDAWFNLLLGGAMIYFALSLFGMYEIELPSALARFTSAHEGQGVLGAMFMALTFTVTSFTCTGPFLGLMLGSIAGVRPPFHHLVFGALVYSATFAAPFFVLALFPSFLKKLPKSGGWLNTVKVSMGFLELAFALKFLANTDIAWNPGNPWFFNYDTVLIAWVVLSIACGLYLLGSFRLPHDDPVEHISAPRMLFASMMFGLALYMVPALFGGKPKGVIADNILAFLPPDLDHKGWHIDYEDAWKEARENHKLIFIDFTGVNCTNCRDNEKNVFPRPEVDLEMKKYVRVQLYTDTVPNIRLSASQAKEQAVRNSLWRDILADPSNPNYIIFRPASDEAFDGEKLKGQVIDRRKGKVFDVQDFVRFLQNPLQQTSQQGTADARQKITAKDNQGLSNPPS